MNKNKLESIILSKLSKKEDADELVSKYFTIMKIEKGRQNENT